VYEAHGWFGLAETPNEADNGALQAKVDEIKRVIDENHWTTTVAASIHALNGQHWLGLTAFANRRREEAAWIDELMRLIGDILPGSWGILYERDDEMPVPPGPNAFRVTVLARGIASRHLDPFLSPSIPIIED
jgi:Immunity protein 7